MYMKQVLIFVIVLCTVVSNGCSEGETNANSNIFRAMDVFDLEYVSDPQISPNGEQIVYVRNSYDVMTDQNYTNLWVINFDGSGNQPLTSGKENHSSPRWSPDGNRLIYVSKDEDGRSQIFCRWMDSGQTISLTNLQKPPRDITCSPDGSKIAFMMDVAEKNSEEKQLKVDLPKKPEGAEWATPAKIIDKVLYRRDGKGYEKDDKTHVFILPAEGGTPQQVTTEEKLFLKPMGDLEWAHDGKSLLLTAFTDDDWEYKLPQTEIVELDVNTKEFQSVTNRKGYDHLPRISPDGEKIAYVGLDDEYYWYQDSKIYLADRDGGNSRQIVQDIQKRITEMKWDSSGEGLYFKYADEGVIKLSYAKIDRNFEVVAQQLSNTTIGRPYALPSEGGFSLSENNRFATTYSSEYQPADLMAGIRGEESKKLTSLNEDLLSLKTLGKVEQFTYDVELPEKPTETIQGWIIKPPDFDPTKKYPLILEIHGGPHLAYGPYFTAELQLMASAGYVVVYVNPRGSTSYTERFAQLIHYNYPGDDYHDLMAGVDEVISRGYIDKQNLFVTGGSGGGILTAWTVTKTDRFNAAVAAKPVINWFTTILTTDGYTLYKYQTPDFPWEAPEYYQKHSPIYYVDNVTTPTMLMTGEEDYRTPISEAEQFYQALQLRKVGTAMVRFPETSHHIATRPSRLISKVKHILAWFEKYRTDQTEAE